MTPVNSDVCCQGEVLGITRFGLAKMKESVLMLASVCDFVETLLNISKRNMHDTNSLYDSNSAEITRHKECVY